MLARMKKPLTDKNDIIQMRHAGVIYQFPKKIAEKYRKPKKGISPEVVFAEIDKKYTKPGVLVRGIRVRENLSQAQLAKLLKVTQSDISQMENGVRRVGRNIAKRIEKLFDINYRSFLE